MTRTGHRKVRNMDREDAEEEVGRDLEISRFLCSGKCGRRATGRSFTTALIYQVKAVFIGNRTT